MTQHPQTSDESTGGGGVRRRALLGVFAAGAGGLVLGLPAQHASAADRAAAEKAVADYLDTSLPLDRRVDALLARLTDEQKLSCLTGLPAMTLEDGYALPARSSAGVEGLHGSGQVPNATMFPQAIGFGSTWDTELVEEMGRVVGMEVRARNPANLRAWAPVADTRSNPLAGRYEEGYGEDPFLSGTLGTAYAFGIKGRHPLYILAKPEMKHFFAYNHEWNRARSSSSMSARALHEFNIVSYRMPVAAGAVLGAMVAYNLVNGVPSNMNPVLKQVREEWAPGSFMFVSDAWDEFNVYATKGAPYVFPLTVPDGADVSYTTGLSPDPADEATNLATAGALLLHSGMSNFSDGNGADFTPDAYARDAVAKGVLGASMADVDRVVRDWLAYQIRSGALDGDASPYNVKTVPPDDRPQRKASSRRLALLAAREQMVLLKNEHGLLPLDRARARRVAVVGPLADVNLRDYYSPAPPDEERVTPLGGIEAEIGRGKVRFTTGTDVVAWRSAAYGTYVTAGTGDGPMTAACTPAAGGVQGGYRVPGGLIGPEQAFRVYDWGYDQQFFRSVASGAYVDTDQDIVNDATELRTSQPTMPDGDAQWNTNTNWHYPRGANGTRSLYGVDYIENDQFYRQYPTGRYVRAEEGGDHRLVPDLSHDDFHSGDAALRATAEFHEVVLERGAKSAAGLARSSDYAVVVVGNNVRVNARESQDRPGLALPTGQLELVRATAAARPGRTVVVIVSSYPYAVQEIQDDPNVAAVLYTSHAGQAAGTALADVLFGRCSPAGRLSSTWLRDESSLPRMLADADGHEPQYTVDMLQYDQLAAKLTYRYSTAPYTYAFGHGLTYTTFRYGKLVLPGRARAREPFTVSLRLGNTGRATSDEVVQVYVRSLDSAYGDNVPVRQLAGFLRVKGVRPGESRTVRVRVDPADLAVWDPVSGTTVVEDGRYEIMVGAASDDIRLRGTLRIAGHTIGTLDLKGHARNAWEHYTVSSPGITHWEVSKENTFAGRGGYHSVASRKAGDHIGFTRVDLRGVRGVELRVATTDASWAGVDRPAVRVHADAPDGPLLGTVSFAPTGGLQDFRTAHTALRQDPGGDGHRALHLVFTEPGIYLDTLRLTTGG
ncbi:glycoside hydrolase family 3 C-terminal domain-containing protein [Streptomyces sp. NPDC050560]|uniref:glycoside hydrolase family 3 C-terminal domain-containing protein n=1 Tax=Streptomyces sp. NPDC050560 TaxID=3365630 RepID=UPI0037B6127F